MNNFSIFIPLAKVDEAKRLVYGTMAVEQPDRSGEIMDYATAKVAIQKWSDGFKNSTGGASLGNVREMHGKVAAGKLVEITFNDDLKKVDVCAYVDDNSSWSKVQKRILNGFSIGGGYADSWPDKVNKALKRYTPSLSEVSLVDMPCMPGATFELIKADGSSETVEWGERGFEPANEDVKAKALSLAKAAGKPDRQNDYVVQARADLIKAHADADDPIAALEAATAAAEALAKGAAEPASPWADMKGAAAALTAIVTAAQAAPLAKGLYTVSWLSDLMACFSDLQSCMASEADWEADGSTLPAKAAKIVADIGALLVQTAQEEAAEAVAMMNEAGVEMVLVSEPVVLELATRITELVKCDAALMEKIGARNSKSDGARIQAIHDHAAGLGATCTEGEESAEKLAKAADLQSEVDRARRAIGAAAPQLRALTKRAGEQDAALAKMAQDYTAELAKLQTQIDTLAKGPGLAKGKLYPVSKDQDDKNIDPSKAPAGQGRGEPTDFYERHARAMEKLGFAAPAPGGGLY